MRNDWDLKNTTQVRDRGTNKGGAPKNQEDKGAEFTARGKSRGRADAVTSFLFPHGERQFLTFLSHLSQSARKWKCAGNAAISKACVFFWGVEF